MINLQKQSKVTLGYFFIVSVLGLYLRFLNVPQLHVGFKGIDFKHILHAHSHVALLGWIYLSLNILIYKLFLKEAEKPKIYKRIFFVTNIALLGMLIAFPLQGYALYSISASTLYLIITYFFTWFVTKYIPEKYKNRFSWKLVRTGLFYLVISSLGTWAVGPIMSTVGVSSPYFNDALYFFLHFLYSGFFFLTLIGVLFYILEKKDLDFSSFETDAFYVTLNIGIFLTYFLSILWTQPPLIFYLLGIIGAVYQLKGFYLLYKILKPQFEKIKSIFSSFSYAVLVIASVLLAIRVILQFLSGIPYFADLVYRLQDFIIGYLHLVFLGVVIPIMMVFMQYFKLIRIPKTAMQLFLITLFITEGLLFLNATLIWLKGNPLALYHQLMAGFSCLFPIAVGWFLFKNLKSS